MTRFQKVYLSQVIMINIWATIIAAVFWSNDFTVTRLALNFIQSLFWAFIWAKFSTRISGWLHKDRSKPPIVKPDEIPVWPPVVDRKE